MTARFELLHDADHPGRSGELSLDELVELYRHPTGPDNGRWLRTNFVATLDGAISGPDGRSGSINTRSDHRLFAVHRAVADVIMVGAETVRTEGYRAVDLTGWQRSVRVELGLTPFPTLAVITGSLRLDPGITGSGPDHGPVLIITTAEAAARAASFRATGISVAEVAETDGRVALPAAVASLVRSGMPRILCEGGPRLHRDLLDADLVDELSLTLAPTVVGGDARRSTSGADLAEQRPFALSRLLRADDETVFLSYRRAVSRAR